MYCKEVLINQILKSFSFCDDTLLRCVISVANISKVLIVSSINYVFNCLVNDLKKPWTDKCDNIYHLRPKKRNSIRY